MPVYNVTIDDASPLIQYDQWWTDSPHTDAFWSNYTDGTFHTSSQQGATAMLTFNGSAVYIFGAKRPNHDVYSVTLDGTATTANGNSAINIFNATLFGQTELDTSKTHQAVLRNEYSMSTPASVDLDYIIITSGDGNASTQSQDTTWDDDHATYSDGWATSPNGLQNNYYNKTMHRTNVANASASMTFTGNAISVYGATSGNHGFFSVSLDSATPIVLNGTIPDGPPRYQNLLYWAGGLSNGQHNVTIANVDDKGNWLDLDKFVVSNWSPSNTSGTATPSSSLTPGSSLAPDTSLPFGTSPTASGVPGSVGDNGSGNSTHHSSTGVIVGGIVAAVAALAFIGLGIFLFHRRRSRLIQRVQPDDDSKESNLIPGAGGPFLTNSFAHGERMPLSLSTLAAGPHGVTQLYASFPTSGTGISEGAGSHLVVAIPDAPDENPHRDMPPPDYEQATSASSSRGPLPPPPIQTDRLHHKYS